MKRLFLITVLASVCTYFCVANTNDTAQKTLNSSADNTTVNGKQTIFSISTGPGADASTQACISWATDSTVNESWVLLAKNSDREWKRAVRISQQQKDWYVSFDGIASVDIKGNPAFEDARFYKCGAMLYGLNKDTDYKYVVCGDDGFRSEEKHFRTAGARKWSCCIISDFHSYPPLPSRLVHSMGMIDTMKVMDPSLDWILCPGDVVAYGGSYSFWKRYFQEPNVGAFLWARVNGNHDNWSKNSYNIGINSFFLGTSYYPHNGYEGQEGVCYHFRYGNTLFLMLNTEAQKSAAGYEKAYAWVRKTVKEARESKNPPTFIVACMHYEWFIGTNGRATQYKKWHEVFDEVGLDLAIAGNNHVYVRTSPLYGDKVSEDGKGTVYLVTSSSDNGRGRNFHETEFQNGDKIAYRWTEGSHTVGAVHMSVDERSISLELMNRKGEVIDGTVIRK